MSVNNPEGVSLEGNLECKRKYSQPRLSFFGNLAGMTTSGAGTVAENLMPNGNCGAMLNMYPCM